MVRIFCWSSPSASSGWPGFPDCSGFLYRPWPWRQDPATESFPDTGGRIPSQVALFGSETRRRPRNELTPPGQDEHLPLLVASRGLWTMSHRTESIAGRPGRSQPSTSGAGLRWTGTNYRPKWLDPSWGLDLRGEPRPALRPPTGQDLATILRSHPCPEAMVALAAQIARLECALHYYALRSCFRGADRG